MRDYKEVLDEHRELKMKLAELEGEMTNCIQQFQGTLEKAIACGLVRPAIPVAPGYTRYLREKFNRQ